MKNYPFLNSKVITVLAFTFLLISETSQTAFATGKITIASTDSSGASVSAATSSTNSISADGRYVAFDSDQPFVSSGDTNGVIDVYIKDRLLGTTVRASLDSSGNQFSYNATSPSIAVNGNLLRVVFLVNNGSGGLDVFVKDFSLPSLSPSPSVYISGGNFPKISANARYVVFQNNVGDIYRKDLQTGAIDLIICAVSCSGTGNGFTGHPAISADGNYVVFQTGNSLDVLDTNAYADIYIRNVSAATTEIVSLSDNEVAGNGPSGDNGTGAVNYVCDVSDDGNYVVFMSNATNFVPSGITDSNAQSDIFIRDRSAGTTTFIGAVDSNNATLNVSAGNPNISGDGHFATFDTGGVNLYDRQIGTLRQINTINVSGSGVNSNNPEISQNGRYISFASQNLTYSSITNNQDIYVHDLISPSQRNTGDFNADGATDLAVYRPSNNNWYVTLSGTGGYTGATLGASGDILAPNDYDGDGKTDYAVFRPSTGVWHILQSSTSTSTTVTFGASGDIPVAADYDGDDVVDIAVFRPSNGTWYSLQSTNGFTGVLFGASGDIPAVGDYDRDGKADEAVFRPSSGAWYLNRSYLGFTGVSFGASGDIPVAADYDGDTETDIAVFRPSNGVWYLQRSNQGFAGISLGVSTDKPVAGDYDNDGKADVAVWRPSNGTWYVQRSTLGYTGFIYGASTDIPVPFGN